VGQRDEFRLSEGIAKVLMLIFSFMFLGPLRKYRAIKASRVARTMIRVANMNYPEVIIESDRIQKLGRTTEKK
jgi:hypothetical protein